MTSYQKVRLIDLIRVETDSKLVGLMLSLTLACLAFWQLSSVESLKDFRIAFAVLASFFGFVVVMYCLYFLKALNNMSVSVKHD